MSDTEFNIIVTSKGCFIQQKGFRHNDSGLRNLRFDGQEPEDTFNRCWGRIDKEPKKVEEKGYDKQVNYRYRLIDKEMESKKIPLLIKKEDLESAIDEDDFEVYWTGKHKGLRGLYTEESDLQKAKYEEVDFKINSRLEVDEVENPDYFSLDTESEYQYSLHKYVDKKVQQKDLTYKTIDQIIYPDLLLANRPCMLASKLSYDIIRSYIKKNIDKKFAKISSDYDFCFTVEKVIPIHDEYSYFYDENLFKKTKKKKMKKKYVTDRNLTVFEMTHDEKNYEGYTLVKPFTGKNLKDLHEKIKKYLDDLIEMINKPVKDCPNCCGRGVV